MERRTIIILAVVGIIVVFLLTLIVGAFRNSSSKPRTQVEAARQSTIRVEDVINEPLVFDGLVIEVEANIRQWVNKKAFFLTTSGGPFGSSEDLLIIADSNFPLPKDAVGTQVGLGEKVKVNLEGRARIVDRKRLEELVGIDLDSELREIGLTGLTNWETGIVIIADRDRVERR